MTHKQLKRYLKQVGRQQLGQGQAGLENLMWAIGKIIHKCGSRG